MRKETQSDCLPDKVEIEGGHLWWGNVMLATIHDNIEVTVEPAELKRYMRLQRQRLRRKQTSRKPRQLDGGR